MFFLRYLEVGYLRPPIKRPFAMSGTKSTYQTPILGQFRSTLQGRKWPNLVPDLNRNFQGASLYSHTVRTGPVHRVPPTSVRQQHACAFLFFFFSLIPADIFPTLQVQRTPFSLANCEGGRHPFFHDAGAFFFLFLFYC